MTMAPGSPPFGVRQLLGSAAVNVLASIGSAVAGLAATAFMARQMTVEDFGRVLLMLTAANAFAIFEGLRPVIVFRVAAGRDDREALFKASARVNAAMAALSVGCVLLAHAMGWTGTTPLDTLLLLSLTAVAYFGGTQYWAFLDAEADSAFTGLVRGLGWALLYGAFALLAALHAGQTGFVGAILLLFMAQWWLFRQRWKRRHQGAGAAAPGEPASTRELARLALSNISFNLCAVTINVGDRAIIGATMGAAAAGLYAGPSELALKASGLIRAAVQVALPWAARQSTENGHRERIWLGTTAVTVAALGTACTGVMQTRTWVTTLLLGPGYAAAADLLGLCAATVLLSAIGYCCIVHLNARGDFRTQRRLYAAAAACLLAGAAWGAQQGSLLLVAAAFVLARSFDLVMVVSILLDCRAAEVRPFLGAAAAIAAALVAAWWYAAAAALGALVVAWWLTGRLAAALRRPAC